jgi:superfamily I DNA and/or RNA helicase
MSSPNSALYYFEELWEIYVSKEIPYNLKYTQLRVLLEKVAKDLTKDQTLQFANLFSRISFLCDTLKLDRNIHSLRITANKILHEEYEPLEEEYNRHLLLLSSFISKAYGTRNPHQFTFETGTPTIPTSSEVRKKTHYSFFRVEIRERYKDHFICEVEEEALNPFIKVVINEQGVNDIFSSANNFWINATLNLVNVEVDENGLFHPRIIILEPDYLVDVSSIAECFQDYGTTELHYLKSKFEEVPNNKHIRLGNFANLVVDELFNEREKDHISFQEIFEKDFKTYPFEYMSCEDLSDKQNFLDYWGQAKQHFLRIKNTIEKEFPLYDITIEDALLEPTFLSEKYGIQGRLDILNLNKNGKSKIVELKSGSVPFPDDGHSIKPNHKAQLYLYYQLVGVTNKLRFDEITRKTDGYILYSKTTNGNLRSDVPTLSQVQSIFDIRNKIILNEYHLATRNSVEIENLFQEISPDNIINSTAVNPRFKEILEGQIRRFREPLKGLNVLEKAYFYSFVNFIAKEQYLAKLGESSGNDSSSNSNGLANLWKTTKDEKEERFEILYDLVITENRAHTDDKEIQFVRSNSENKFVNFREGDICVLYPRDKDEDTATSHQIFKCSIKNISKDQVTIQFRFKQRNTNYFEQFGRWAIERDFMDYSFTSMYRNLYTFISAPVQTKSLILTTKEPGLGTDVGFQDPQLSEEQNRVINKALSAKDYFLLNGPPGTGKTSKIIARLIQELYRAQTFNILLLAYTNRAVDELCDAVNTAEIVNFDDINDGLINPGVSQRTFIRIGSDLSCNEKHRHNLLQNIIEGESLALEKRGDKLTRQKINDILSRHRIFVSTVSSISGKSDLLSLKKFDVVIVDEASQILEPQIVGILSKCSKFILIGDHNQLPAIVLQSAENAKTKNEALEEIGLYNRKNSLFERLYSYCENNEQKHAFDKLTYQGRMHREIAIFPNHSFYHSSLKQLYELNPLLPSKELDDHRQFKTLELKSPKPKGLSGLLSQKRLIFFQSETDRNNRFGKSNEQEATLVVKLIKTLQALYSFNKQPFDFKNKVGVITPFRNQIALIKRKLEEAEIENFEEITVDTVERFQGSERDIIIYSFVINNPYQLSSIINLNDDASVDRKLNVALTRAKEQLILIGNDTLLSNEPLFYRLIEFIKSQGGYIGDPISKVLEETIEFKYYDSDDSIEGKEYTPDEEFKNMFDQLVIEPLKNDPRTEWPNRILGLENNKARNNVISYGMTSFDEAYKDPEHSFSNEDKVNLYCYWNMRKHYFSGYSIFDGFRAFFELELENSSGRIVFIDVGCGPMTTGIAFNQAIKKNRPEFSFDYCGIDVSDAMKKKALSFANQPIFNAPSKFRFYSDLAEIVDDFNDQFSIPHTVILNFSYIFSNLDLDEVLGLAKDVNHLISQFPLNRYILLYQNPINRHHNFSKFKEELKGLRNSIVRKTETVYYKNAHQSWYDKSEKFTYEIITN